MRPPPVTGGGVANGRAFGAESVHLGRQLDITILEAHLVRIFDSMKVSQDVFVQLVCGYEDGSEKVVGRTPSHKNGNLTPKWNQTFETRRGGGKTLKLKVFCDHLFRNPVLCGEAEFDLDTLWTRSAGAGTGLRVPVNLYKRGEQTGVLYIGLVMQPNEAMGAPPPQQQPQRTPQQPGMGGMPAAAAGGAAGAAAANGLRRGPSKQGDAAWGAPYPGGGGAEAKPAPPGYPGAAPAAAGGQWPPAAAVGRQSLGMQPQDAGGGLPAQFQQALQVVQPQAQLPPAPVQPQPALVQQAQQAHLLPLPQAGGGALPPPSGGPLPGTQQSVYASGMSGQWWNSFIDRG